MKGPERGRLRIAFLISAVLHGGVIVLFWATASRAGELPKMRVYAVNIVSPPPQEQGEWSPEPETPLPPLEETAPEPEPEAPAPEPEPEPLPAPPVKREPSPAPTPTKKPEPAKKAEPEKKAQPAKETPPAKPARSTGANPDPKSTGGENLDVRVEGAEFVDPAYLANVTRQLYRYFRPPANSRTDQAEVSFKINRDGSVSEIRPVNSSGSFQFRLKAMEAVEQAGLDKAFGPLPKAYPADQLLISFYFRPAR